MFDAIAHRYDFLNHFLSAGLDRRWRARAVEALRLRGGEVVLDVCTGTADLALAALSGSARPARVVAIDFAGEMLRRARPKLTRAPVALVRGDATMLPVRSSCADAVTIAFGIRNVADIGAALAELRRALKPGGRVAILEFGTPRVAGVRQMYRFYFSRVLPRLGGLISGNRAAYAYLPASVDEFPSPAEFAARLTAAGFRDARAVRLSAGIVYLYTAAA